ncbi:MAG TPA: tetratricopeptide repeat protein [Rhodanobacteraceae bacterium]|nr:tetratricopeptide repeat protein [Rhodanobacteraceae bacterium]
MLDDIIELHRAGRLNEAEAGYRELLASNPDDAEALHLLGILRGQAGDAEEGLALVQSAIERDPQRDVFQHTLGEMHLHAGRLDEAEAAYLRAKELNPNLTSAHSGLGQIAFLRGDLDNAEQHFRIALRADENDAQSHAGLGNIHLSRNELRRASVHLTRAAELSPNDALIQGSLANVMLALNTPDFAIQAANNALALKPDYAMARQVLGNALLARGDAEGARAAFETLVSQNQQLAMAHLGLGDVARTQQRHDEAIAHYQQALQHQPDLHPAAIRRADSLGRSGRADQAIIEMHERARRYPDAPYVKVALASLLDQRGRAAEALPVWREAAALLPDNANVQANLALALDSAGEHQAAAEQAGRVGGPPRPALALVRARAAWSAGDGLRALEALHSLDEAQWEARPELARRRWKLSGLAHDALSRWKEAVVDFRRALSNEAPPLPELPLPDGALIELLRERAAEPGFNESQFAAPVLLTGLPGSGTGRLAALLADQPGWVVRRDRFSASTDFVSAAFDERLLRPLSQSDLAFLQRRYVRPLQRSGLEDGAGVIDWLPYLDARVLPALKRALPGVRLIQVQCDPRDALLNWLVFGGNAKLLMRDPLEAARWMKADMVHQALAVEMLPACRVDADAVLADPQGEAGQALAHFLGLERLQPGPLSRAAEKNRRGMPVSFEPGHAEHYREALAEAFAALA